MDAVDVAVIGGGFAGAATACFLTRLGIRNVLLLEQEGVPGVHSSGRNAAMIRRIVNDPAIGALAREGADFIGRQPQDWASPAAYERNGSLLLAQGEGFEALKADADDVRRAGVQVEIFSPSECLERAPWIEGDPFDGGAWCPEDGVVDIAGLLDAYMQDARSRGARIEFGARVTGFSSEDGRLTGIRSTVGDFAAKTVVNASGAWAGELGRMAGATDVGLVPYRRHLFVSDHLDGIDPGWPFVWDVSHEAYFRPEPPGLLLCACDQQPHEPKMPRESPEALEWLAEKMAFCFPRLADVSVARHWAGLRTMAPDHRFVIGWDAALQGFFWVAGLGGHGVTTSAAVGRLAAELVAQGSGAKHDAFDPARFGVSFRD